MLQQLFAQSTNILSEFVVLCAIHRSVVHDVFVHSSLSCGCHSLCISFWSWGYSNDVPRVVCFLLKSGRVELSKVSSHIHGVVSAYLCVTVLLLIIALNFCFTKAFFIKVWEELFIWYTENTAMNLK